MKLGDESVCSLGPALTRMCAHSQPIALGYRQLEQRQNRSKFRVVVHEENHGTLRWARAHELRSLECNGRGVYLRVATDRPDDSDKSLLLGFDIFDLLSYTK